VSTTAPTDASSESMPDTPAATEVGMSLPAVPDAEPGPVPGSGGRDRLARARKRRRRWRVARRTVAIVLIVLLIPVGWSYVDALRARGTDPWQIRSVEWIRDHGGAGVVNWVEHWWYSNHEPPKGGKPEHGIPEAQAPEGVASRGKASKTPPASTPAVAPHLTPPPNIQPLADPALSNEGVWQPTGRLVQGLPAVYTAFMRPDPVHTSLVTGLAWMDTRLLRSVFVPGLQEPGNGIPNPWDAQIPEDQRGGLIAAFNSGFKMSDANGGLYSDGVEYKPLRDGAASFVIYQDGTATVGMWGRDVTMSPNIKTVRQNLDLMVDGGQSAAGLSDDSTTKWGATLGNKVFVWRSAVGVDANGGLIFVGGNGLNAATLGDVLVHAGAVRAMELDINSEWVSYFLYDPVDPANPLAVQGRKLVPDMQRGEDRYLVAGERDFFALFAR
jgi:Phosphodiester glycosidase